MLALIMAALNGLASLPKLLEFFEKLNLDARLGALEAKQQAMNEGFMQLAGAKTDDDYAKALSTLATRINS